MRNTPALTKHAENGTNDSAMPIHTEILQGDCRDILRKFDAGTFDLIVTSPSIILEIHSKYKKF
jgi:predicted methyltransferase